MPHVSIDGPLLNTILLGLVSVIGFFLKQMHSELKRTVGELSSTVRQLAVAYEKVESMNTRILEQQGDIKELRSDLLEILRRTKVAS